MVARIGREIDGKGLKRIDLYKIVPSGTLSNWKNRGREPSAYTLHKVAVFLGVSVDYLLTGKNADDLSEDERNLLTGFRVLDNRDQNEILGIVQLKLNNTKKGDISSSSETA